MNKKLLLLVFLSVLLFAANLGGLSIYILDEAKNSTAAREMLEGDHIVPTFNYELRTDKPPLHYYFMMGAYSVFGVNEFAARFFSAVCGILLIISTYLFTQKFVNESTAFWACIAMLSSIQFIVQFHMAVPDPYLILFFVLTIYFSYAFYRERKRMWIYLAYCTVSLAVLSKGPVALVLVSAAWLVFLFLKKDLSLKTVLSFRPLEGLLILLLLIAPWYLLVHVQTDGEWTKGFFLKHNLERFTSTMEGHGGSFLLIPLYVILGLFPFSFFIIQTCRYFFKQRPENDFLLLAVVVSLTIIVFFSFSRTKLPSYPAPCLPFVAILLGYYLDHHLRSRNSSFLWSYGVYFIVGAAITIGVYLVVEDVLKIPEMRHQAFWFLLLPSGAIAAVGLFLRKYSVEALGTMAVSSMLTILAFFYLVFPAIDKKNPVVQALQILRNKEPVYFYGNYNPSFSFYMQKKIPALEEAGSSLTEPALILSMKKKMSELEPLQSKYEMVFSSKEFFEPYYTVVFHKTAETLSFENKKLKE